MAESGAQRLSALEVEDVRAFLKSAPEVLRDDTGLLAELGLRVADNVVEFAPAAIAKATAAHRRETRVRRALEEAAHANFAAQAQTHGAVVDLLDSRGQADLAARLDELAVTRFGLVGAAIALEGAPAPAGWRALDAGGVDWLVGRERLARMGPAAEAARLFGAQAAKVQSVALARLGLGPSQRPGLVAFGAAEVDAFAPGMGAELITFLARVLERTAARWPIK